MTDKKEYVKNNPEVAIELLENAHAILDLNHDATGKDRDGDIIDGMGVAAHIEDFLDGKA